jgi:hypothetical protein
MSVFLDCAGSVSIPTLSRASIPEKGQTCDHFHAFSGVILRYPGENAVLSDKGRIKSKKTEEVPMSRHIIGESYCAGSASHRGNLSGKQRLFYDK